MGWEWQLWVGKLLLSFPLQCAPLCGGPQQSTLAGSKARALPCGTHAQQQV